MAPSCEFDGHAGLRSEIEQGLDELVVAAQLVDATGHRTDVMGSQRLPRPSSRQRALVGASRSEPKGIADARKSSNSGVSRPPTNVRAFGESQGRGWC